MKELERIAVTGVLTVCCSHGWAPSFTGRRALPAVPSSAAEPHMMHFEMLSKRIAKQEDSQVAECCGPTQVNQCYRCHQTTSWNDIKGVGWYKHH